MGAAGETDERTRFHALDACRGLCAVAVVLFHLDAATHFYSWPAVRNAYVAVDFFFVLSGFVIASAYGDRIRTVQEAGRFALRRFGRLYPLHLVVLVAYVLVELIGLAQGSPAFVGNFSGPALAANLALVQGFGAWHETWNYPAWSVCVELWVNLGFAAVLSLLGRRSVTAAIAVLLLSAAYVAFAGNLLPVSPEAQEALMDVAQSAFGFVLGVGAFHLFKRLRSAGWRPDRRWEALAVGLVVLVFGWRDSLPGLASPVAFAAVVFILAFEAGPVSQWLAVRPLQKLGAVSYSVYLTHSLYLAGLEWVVLALGHWLGLSASIATASGDDLLTLGGPWAMDAAAIAVVALTLASSGLTYRYIEEPYRRFFNALARRQWPRRIPSAAAAPAPSKSS